MYIFEMDILSKTEIKKILRQLDKQFDFKEKMDYVFLKNTKNKIFIVSKDLEKIKLGDFKINTSGLYIIKEEKDGLRLSIDGSQIIGPKCGKNILVLDDINEWLTGYNVKVDTKLKGYVIVKCKDDFLGCGKIVKGKLLNYIPKSRRISELAPS